MEQSDLDLLQTAPSSHLQVVVKARQVPVALKGQTAAASSAPNTSTVSATSSALAANVEEIARYLFDPESIARVLNELPELDRTILAELVASGGRANSRDLALYLSSSDLLNQARKDIFPETDENGNFALEPERYQSSTFSSGPGQTPGLSSFAAIQAPQYPGAHPHGIYEQALRRLLTLGLLFWGKQTSFASRDYTSGIHDGVLIVPQTVRNVVRASWGEPKPFTDVLSESASLAIDEGRQLQRALYLYWSLVATQREGLSLISTGQLSRAALRLVLEQMGYTRVPGESQRVESDIPRLLFIRLLLTKLGLLQERQGAVFAAPIDAFFSLSLLERMRRCYRLWLETPFWNEMNYLPEVTVRPGPGTLEPAHEEVVHARQAVTERLMYEGNPGEWHELTTFIARTKLHVPYLLFPRQYGPRAERYSGGSNPYGWDFRLRRGWLTHREGWHMVEGGFIRAIITGPLHWMGLIELNREEGASAFRLSAGSALIMSDTPPVEREEVSWGRLIVQPNFDLVVLAPVSEKLLISLDRFAERVSLEHIAQYRLTRASVTRAIQMGLHADALRAILEQAAGGEIPQNVQYSLVEWERQARRVEVWQGATLLEVDDAALLDELLGDEAVKPLLGRRLAAQLVEVMPGKLEAVQHILWRRSYLPAFVAAPTQDAITSEGGRMVVREPQWRLHSDGLLQPFYAVTDLYLAAEVERFSELDEQTGWRKITPTALIRALRGGILLEHIVRFLQQYCEGGIPGSFLIRLKLWGSGYTERSTIYIEHSPLLRLSEQVLRDIQADEELSGLLGAEIDPGSRLVHIKAEQLERVLEILKERGFSVE